MQQTTPPGPGAWLHDGGQMATRVAEHDWAGSPLGPVASWPAALHPALSILFASRSPMCLAWGPRLVLLHNDGFRPVLGALESTALGRGMAEVWAERWPGSEPLVDAALAGTPTAADALRPCRPSADHHDGRWSLAYSPVRDEHGAVAGILVEAIDASAQAVVALPGEGQRQRDALDTDPVQQVAADANRPSLAWQVTPELLAVLSAEGLLEQTNPAWQQTLGWSAQELALRPCWDYVHPDDLPATLAAIESMRSGEPILRFENRYRTRDGDYRCLSWVATREHGRYYCSARDVTAIRAAARALEISQARLRTQFETSYQLQGLCALDGTLVDANQTALDAVEARFEDVVGQPLWSAPWFSATTGMEARIRAAFERAVAGESIREEIAVLLPAGARVYDFSLRPIRDPRGEITAVVPEAIDITERRATEEALRQSQKLEAMGQLTGGVAHDFNNLLTPIVIALELAADDSARPERRRRVLAAARRSAERAATLVQRLLAFARKQPLQACAVDVERLVLGMADLVVSTCEPRVHVRIHLQPRLARAIADANQLEMAILNLAVNARDAMPDGGVLTIAASNRRVGADDGVPVRAGDYVLLTVSDTGHGMDRTTQLRAIEPFFSTKGVGKGTGLGLSMVHGLASQLGGQLVIDSAPGEGTDMQLWLPVGDGQSDHFEEEADLETMTGNRRVALVVDDEDAVRMCTADVLDDMGYEVIEAASAEDAIAAIDRGVAPEILVTDYLMPGMSGSELAAIVKRRFPDAAVVVVSGYTDVEGLDVGLVLLNKPFRQRDLMASVQAAHAVR